jgi:azurin
MHTASTKAATTKTGSAKTASNATAAQSGANTKAGAQAKRMTAMPASWTNGPDQSISIGTKPGLKFDQEKIEVKAGSRIKLSFNNNDDMLHNFVVVQPGTAIEVGNMAVKLGLDGANMHYIPKTEKVIYHTNLLQPETTETIYFTAPTTPGEYTYVCTFPGHAYVMQGILKVVAK